VTNSIANRCSALSSATLLGRGAALPLGEVFASQRGFGFLLMKAIGLHKIETVLLLNLHLRWLARLRCGAVDDDQISAGPISLARDEPPAAKSDRDVPVAKAMLARLTLGPLFDDGGRALRTALRPPWASMME